MKYSDVLNREQIIAKIQKLEKDGKLYYSR